VLISRFLRVLIEFFMVSCKTLSWREELSIGLWSIIFAMAANIFSVFFRSGTWPLKATRCRHSHPVRRLCLSRHFSLHHEANSVEYVVFDWPNMVMYQFHKEIMEPWPV